MRANILSVGNELVTGQVIDTNAAHIAGMLARHGVAVAEHCTVNDEVAPIRDAIVRLAGQCEVLVVTGGLGPTRDDLTRQGLAEAMGVDLFTDPQCLRDIEEHFRRRGWPMAESNRRQALMPRGAEALRNAVGTAPGMAARVGGCQVFVLPGVPGEMRHMLAEHVEPRLPGGGAVIVHRSVHTFGLGESGVGAKIADLMDRDANPTVGTTASAGMVSIRITARGDGAEHAEALAGGVIDEVTARLGELVVGADDQTMGAVVGRLLVERGATLAAAESCTGGLIGKMVTDVPGSSRYFLGGVVAYSNAVKQSLLGVPPELIDAHGAVSEPVAAAMAEGVRRSLGSDYGLAVTGIAGPDGGSEEKPIGTVCVALAGPGFGDLPPGQAGLSPAAGSQTHTVRLGGDREAVRLRAALNAMNMLRLELLRCREQ